jgi:dihydrofolate synthase/folylpolyglutamate synthase
VTAGSGSRIERILEELEHFGVKLGLERMRLVLAGLGGPERGLPVVLVAGTNGKGSTAVWVAAVLSAAGYRSGLYTSPHLECVEERLRVDGRAIDRERLESLLVEVLEASRRAGGEPVTYFEALTAAALCHFREERVDLAVMEVGMGGRLDATNVTEPLLSLVTQIALDHQRQLGQTVAEIAVEKAGIFRPGRPALTSAADPDAIASLEREARRRGAHLELASDLVRQVGRRELPQGGQRVELETVAASYRLAPRLAGRHQVDNLALAVAAAERLAALGFGAIDGEAIRRGVDGCDWPGRLEWVRLPGGAEVLLDAAHNPAGLAALSAYLHRLDRPFHLVFGMLREKVDAAVVGRLWRMAATTVVTRPRSDRALSPAELVEEVGVAPSAMVDLPTEAMQRALESGSLVVACGSIYLVGELRGWLRRTYGVPPEAEDLFHRR